MRFKGRGDGHYQNDRGANDRLDDCNVEIGRDDNVRVNFETDRHVTIAPVGRIVRNDPDRIVARVTGTTWIAISLSTLMAVNECVRSHSSAAD